MNLALDLADDGCPDLHIPSCFSCPLPACRYDYDYAQVRYHERKSKGLALLAQGLTRNQVAAVLSIGVRTVDRWRQEKKSAPILTSS